MTPRTRTEHCLEVQLPFLQRILPSGWSLVPLVVGHAPAADVAAVLAQALPDALLVVSTDLSHYLPYRAAAVRDRRTANAITTLDAARITDDDACGAYALRGALRYLRENRLPVRELDLRSSGDTAGPRDRVVGYGSFLIWARRDAGPGRATAELGETGTGRGAALRAHRPVRPGGLDPDLQDAGRLVRHPARGRNERASRLHRVAGPDPAVGRGRGGPRSGRGLPGSAVPAAGRLGRRSGSESVCWAR